MLAGNVSAAKSINSKHTVVMVIKADKALC